MENVHDVRSKTGFLFLTNELFDEMFDRSVYKICQYVL